MSQVDGFAFLRALRKMNLQISELDSEKPSLAGRPRKIVGRLEKLGVGLESTRPEAGQLSRHGFEVKTIFDVGVDAGTPFLYDAFPDTDFVLVDPISESEQRVSAWADKINYTFYCCALGDEEGEAEINLPTTTRRTAISRASLEEFSDQYKENFESIEKRVVPVQTLDNIAANFEGPFGIKVDTEGFEMNVLAGAQECLSRTEFVIVEASVRERFKNGYRFSELVGFLGKHGFEILEFLRPIRPNSADCDVLFARYDSKYFQLG